jgi:hypothetical protein
MSFIVSCHPRHHHRHHCFDESVIWNSSAPTNNKIANYLCPNTPLRAFHPGWPSYLYRFPEKPADLVPHTCTVLLDRRAHDHFLAR